MTVLTADPLTALPLRGAPIMGLPINGKVGGAPLVNPNLFTNPEALNLWSLGSTTNVDVDATDAPDGTTTVERIEDDNGGGSAGIYVSQNETLVLATDYIASFFVKPDQLDFCYIRTLLFDASANGRTWFNANTGALLTQDANHSAAGVLTGYANGFVRVWVRFQVASGDATGAIRLHLAESDGDISVDRDGTSSMFGWGAKLEQASVISAYQSQLGTIL